MADKENPSLIPYAPAAWAAVCGIAASGLELTSLTLLVAPIMAWLAADSLEGFIVVSIKNWWQDKSLRVLLIEALVVFAIALGLVAHSAQAVLIIIGATVINLAALLLPKNVTPPIHQATRVAASWLAAHASLGMLTLPSLLLGLGVGLMTALRTGRHMLVLRVAMGLLWGTLAVGLFLAHQPQLGVPVVAAGLVDIGLAQDIPDSAPSVGWSVSMLLGALASVYWNI